MTRAGSRFEWTVVGLFFALLLVLGLGVAGDYGISWDEYVNRENGGVAYNYVAKGDTHLFDYDLRNYGTAVELPLYAMEVSLGLTDSRPIFFMRHRCTFLLFFAGVACFYGLARKLLFNWVLALTGCAMLVLSPRIFGQAFYNSKDLAFLSLFVVSMYTLLVWLEAKTIRHAVLHGLACAVLIDTRVVGIILPAFTLLFAAFDYGWVDTAPGRTRRWLASLPAYLVALAGFTILCWPLLWRHPFSSLLGAIREMSRFNWLPGDVLYLGQDIDAAHLPWHYIPVWIGVSTPLPYLVLGATGLATLVVYPFQAGTHRGRDLRNTLVVLLWLFAPIVTVIGLKSILYDSWRQLYFVYPALVLLAVAGVRWLWEASARATRWARVLRRLTVVGTTAAFLPAAIFMCANHPFEDVYFNRLAGRDMLEVKQRFELDYWGLSYRQALECLLARDARPQIRVLVANDPGRYNGTIIPLADRRRLAFVEDQKDADYFVSNFRWHRAEYATDASREVCAVVVGNAKINVAYRLR
jgi:hypothetical protein